MAKGAISLCLVYGCGVCIEGHGCLDDGEVVRCPCDYGYGGIREAFLDFSGSSDAVTMLWACGRFPEVISDVFLLFYSRHGRCKKQ